MGQRKVLLSYYQGTWTCKDKKASHYFGSSNWPWLARGSKVDIIQCRMEKYVWEQSYSLAASGYSLSNFNYEPTHATNTDGDKYNF